MKAKDHPQYKLYAAEPPKHRGNGAASAYFVGLAGHRCRYVAGSHAWAAWHAGKDARRGV